MSRDEAPLLDILRYSDRALRAAHGRRLEELERGRDAPIAPDPSLASDRRSGQRFVGRISGTAQSNPVDTNRWNAGQTYSCIPANRLGSRLEIGDRRPAETGGICALARNQKVRALRPPLSVL